VAKRAFVVGEADVMIDIVPHAAKHAQQLLELEGQIGSLIAVSSSAIYADAAGKPLVLGGAQSETIPSRSRSLRRRSLPMTKPTRDRRSLWSMRFSPVSRRR
jgi:hypothetical protein